MIFRILRRRNGPSPFWKGAALGLALNNLGLAAIFAVFAYDVIRSTYLLDKALPAIHLSAIYRWIVIVAIALNGLRLISYLLLFRLRMAVGWVLGLLLSLVLGFLFYKALTIWWIPGIPLFPVG